MSTPGADRARTAVHYAIKKGKLPAITKETKCVDCGAPAKHYDHRDYGKPLVVEPVCHLCNVRRGPGKEFIYKRQKHVRRSAMLTIPQSLALREIAEKTGTPIGDMIRFAVDAYLKGVEK